MAVYGIYTTIVNKSVSNPNSLPIQGPSSPAKASTPERSPPTADRFFDGCVRPGSSEPAPLSAAAVTRAQAGPFLAPPPNGGPHCHRPGAGAHGRSRAASAAAWKQCGGRINGSLSLAENLWPRLQAPGRAPASPERRGTPASFPGRPPPIGVAPTSPANPGHFVPGQRALRTPRGQARGELCSTTWRSPPLERWGKDGQEHVPSFQNRTPTTKTLSVPPRFDDGASHHGGGRPLRTPAHPLAAASPSKQFLSAPFWPGHGKTSRKPKPAMSFRKREARFCLWPAVAAFLFRSQERAYSPSMRAAWAVSPVSNSR
jgi:hypothetical protein